MNIIKETTSYILEIKKSEFISIIYFVKNKEEVNNYLNITKNKYKDATHYCYAYIIDNNIYCSDNGEPAKTAGLPILNIIKKNSLNYTLIIVIRYYGGIKLGTGGLIRAYTSASKNLLKKTELINIIPGILIQITVPYDKQAIIEKIISNKQIKEKNYLKEVTYLIETTKEELTKIPIPYQIINNNIYIKTNKR
ncbi:MAG: YigZ family protein [Bacilli bacterium]